MGEGQAGAPGAVTPHGWFEIEGVQTGEYKVKDRLLGLRPLIKLAKGGSILDVGCAEGLLGRWLWTESNAKILHGLEVHVPFLEMARKIAAHDDGVAYFHANLDMFGVWLEANPTLLLPQYDVVLALCIVQKMSHPEVLLRQLAQRTKRALVIHAPSGVIEDPRSRNRRVDIREVLRKHGLQLVHDASEAHIYRGIFERRRVRR